MIYDNNPNLQSSIDPLPETISFLLQMQIFQGLEWEYEKSGIFPLIFSALHLPLPVYIPSP